MATSLAATNVLWAHKSSLKSQFDAMLSAAMIGEWSLSECDDCSHWFDKE